MMHIYMERSQGNSLCSYPKQAKMSYFFFCKIEEQEGRPGPAWEGGWCQGEEKDVGKGHGGG
jgi:hypothetical protein